VKSVALPRIPLEYPRTHILRDFLLVPATLWVVALDQLSKYLVHRFMAVGTSLPEAGLLRITHVTNSGGAFGFFPDQTLILTAASFVGIGVLLLFYWSHSRPSRLVRLSLGLQLGGAVGNLVDRLRAGEVVDFIDVGPWPVFNLADSSIVIGLGLLLGLFLASDWGGRRRLGPPPLAHAPSGQPPPELAC
jgi:signal peptidase II